MSIGCFYFFAASSHLLTKILIFTIHTCDIRKLPMLQKKYDINLRNIIPSIPKKTDGSHASMLFELKELISKRVGFVITSYVLGSIFRTSPPCIRGDFAIDHRVICGIIIHSLSLLIMQLQLYTS